ncbi:MAG: hypothetical protein JNL22_03170 [Bacteroidales bacterium]|nr:hypothetical protein [Bacteroidales bacterium]
MKTKVSLILILTFLNFGLSGLAQVNQEIFEKVKQTPKKDLISIVGKYEVNEQIIKAENLVFHEKSELVFTNYNVPYVVIAVKNLKFNAPQVRSIVRFKDYDLVKLKGQKGVNGGNGANGTSDGSNGKPGRNGGTGRNGLTQKMPDIYIMVENIATDIGDLGTFDWVIDGNGVKGGTGGDGGDGGSGGNGSKGKKSSDGFGTCKRGGQNGGHGANGGKGGIGGKGGNGGNGANIYLVGNNASINRLTYAQYLNDGGMEGDGGKPGKSGAGGKGGKGGDGSTFCSGGNNGGDGSKPSANIKGQNGNKGKKGQLKITEREISDLF